MVYEPTRFQFQKGQPKNISIFEIITTKMSMRKIHMLENLRTTILLLLILPEICLAGNIDYKDVQEGIFKSRTHDGGLNTIIRTKNKQTEISGKNGVIIEFDIEWTSDSTYLLFNQKVVKRY